MYRVMFPVLICALIGLTATWAINDNGIHRHVSGRATYLDGEACIVDANKTVTREQYRMLLNWCESREQLDRTPRKP